MRRALATSWLAVTASALGCGADRVTVALPELAADTESWLIARIGKDGEVRVSAADPSTPAVEVPADEAPVAIELREYDRALAALELAPGPIRAAVAGEPSALLPAGSARHTALEDLAASPWIDGGLDDVARFRRPVASACGTITTSIATLPSKGSVEWVQSLDGDTVLIGTSTFEVILLAVGREPRLVTVRAPERTRLMHAFRDASRQLWVADADGGLWRGRLVGTELTLARAVPASPALGPVRRVAGDPADPEHGQLFVITASGAIARVRDGAYEVVDRYELGFDTGDDAFSLVWLGPDDLFHAHAGAPDVIRWRPPGPQTEALNAGGSGIIALDHYADGRVVAAMGSGLIAIWRDGMGWERLDRAKLSLDVRGTYPIAGGFLYGGSYGYLGQWMEKEGFCPIQEQPLAAHTVDFIRPFGDRWIVLGESRPVFPQTPYLLIRLE